MTKRQIYRVIEWSVAIAACGYLIWRLATYEDYASLAASLRAMGWKEWGALVLCVALMPVNMAIEAWRWKTLWNGEWLMVNGEGISFYEAQRQVYYSKLAGVITPWRLGEYPARGVLMSEGVNELKNERIWPRVLSMGVVGSATMTMAIVLAGVAAMMISNFRFLIFDWGFSYIIAISIFLILLGVALYFAPRLLKRWATVSHGLIIKSVGQSLVRLVCWCVQLGLVLYALGAIFDFRLLIFDLPVYYLFVTITPNVPIAEVGVRGAWAMVVFGTANAALAGVILWAINTLLPCVIGLFLRKKQQ